MDDLLGLPDIDPAIPEPDFFDAQDDLANVISPPHNSRTSTMTTEEELQISAAPPENILEDIVTNELKYNDEECAFDEFLVGLPKFSGKEEGMHNGAEEVEAKGSQEDGKGEENEDFESKEDADERNSEGGSSKNDPGTPDSRSGAAVVRLSMPSLPKVAFDSKKHASESREETPRMTRGRLNPPSPPKYPVKRKFKDTETDEDYEELEEEEEGEETSILNRRNTTRSGRQTRNIARYGHGKKGRGSDDSETKNKRLKNSSETSRTSRSGYRGKEAFDVYHNSATDFDSAESDLFIPITIRPTKYWDGEDGTIYFTDRYGKTTTLRRSAVSVKRFTEDDIRNAKKFLADEAARRQALVEICIDNFRSAEEGAAGGAKRFELCSSLAEGGLTPSIGFLSLVKKSFPEIPVMVMIRPRGGDFCYSPAEIEIMSRDIHHHKQNGADGFVFGVLTKDAEVDEEACESLLDAACPLPCTFHRAFDRVPEPILALESVIKLRFTRILTSGLRATAHAGIPTLKRLVEAADGRIIIMAGAGVNGKNVGDIVKKTGVMEVHGSGSTTINSQMISGTSGKGGKKGRPKKGQSSAVKMGTVDDFILKVTDSALVSDIVKHARRPV